nr:DUF1800 family protein [Acanthopleuribacter pedis]
MSLPSQLKHRGLGTYFLTQAVANQAFTLEWDWTYAAADTESQQLFRINQRFSRNPVLLAYVRDGRFRFWFMGREFVNPHRLIADRRYHAAVTWDGSALHIYMNGEKSAKFEWNPEGFDAGLPRNLDFQIGDDQGFPVFGVLHGLALYARALDAAEIDINYAARNRVTETADTVTRQPVIPAGTTEEAVDLARHVLNRAAFGASPESLRALLTVGTESWLEQQLEPEQIALPASVTALEHIYQPQASKENLQAWLTARMVHSPRQLEEVMAWFWENHFHTDLTKTADPAAEYAENQRFRSLALGSFTDLLAASARNTPMIRYLDGDTNIAAAPNENYAREILELHSFGEDNGYNYADIVAAARIFSGWTYQDGVFHFAPGAHDYGVKALFGLRFDQREGADEGLVLIQHIATAPETAQFISTKLCRFFLADEPPQDAVDAATQRFLETDGDIREVVRTILFHPRFLDDAQYRGNKLKTPLEFVVSMQRAVGAADDQHVYRAGLEHMGMPLFDYPYPTGYAERGTPWRNTNAVFYRWQLVNQFCNNRRWANQPALDAAAWAARYGVSDAETAFDLLQAMLGFGPEHRAKMEPLLVQDNGRVFDLREAPERDHFVQRLSWVLNAGLRGAAFQHQ